MVFVFFIFSRHKFETEGEDIARYTYTSINILRLIFIRCFYPNITHDVPE